MDTILASGDRVSWPESKTIDGQTIPAGTGTIVGRGNTHWLVRSDEVLIDHGEWKQHRLLKLNNVQRA